MSDQHCEICYQGIEDDNFILCNSCENDFHLTCIEIANVEDCPMCKGQLWKIEEKDGGTTKQEWRLSQDEERLKMQEMGLSPPRQFGVHIPSHHPPRRRPQSRRRLQRRLNNSGHRTSSQNTRRTSSTRLSSTNNTTWINNGENTSTEETIIDATTLRGYKTWTIVWTIVMVYGIISSEILIIIIGYGALSAIIIRWERNTIMPDDLKMIIILSISIIFLVTIFAGDWISLIAITIFAVLMDDIA